MNNNVVSRIPVFLLFFLGFGILTIHSNAQTTTLADCFSIAREHNLSLRQAKAALLSSQYNLQAEKKSFLPKVDLLSSYTYLSSPLTINLQTVRSGIIEGSSMQSVNAANDVFKDLTGNNLSQAAQDRIYNASKSIIGGIYPDYNPSLSKQSYFVAGLGVRQPLFLGHKLDAAGNLAQSFVNSADINVAVIDKEVDFLLTVQYLRILYLNTLLTKQQAMVQALNKNKAYAQQLVKNEVLAPYQKSWTNVILIQAESQANNIKLEKQNALVELNKLMGVPLDSAIVISDTLKYIPVANETPATEFWQTNPVYKLAGSKMAYAQSAEKISRSFSLPNIFAVGNYNLFQRDLPVFTPDWFVGVELQWSLFDGQTHKRTIAARQLMEEATLGEQNAALGLQVLSRVSSNKMLSLQSQVAVLDSARRDAHTTSLLVTERMRNQLSSPKDVNDALIIETEIEKDYFTAVFGYFSATAEYFNSLGKPQQITQYIK